MLKALMIGLILLISSCTSLKGLKPTDYVYKITEEKPCYYKNLKDLQEKKNISCKEFKDLEGWLVIYPEKLKRLLTDGLDELIEIKNR